METKENKEKCKDCINFDVTTGWSGDDDGCCKRLGSNKLIIFDAKQNQFISFNRDSNPQSVHVGKNFGCIFFEAKNEEINEEINNESKLDLKELERRLDIALSKETKETIIEFINNQRCL